MAERKMLSNHIDTASYIEKLNVQGQPLKFAELVIDEDTGMLVRYLTYYKGTMTPPHTHHCSHGMFVISGKLRTQDGDFGPGSMVWFPEGMVGFHGATEEEDFVGLFITNKPFDITYENPEFNAK